MNHASHALSSNRGRCSLRHLVLLCPHHASPLRRDEPRESCPEQEGGRQTASHQPRCGQPGVWIRCQVWQVGSASPPRVDGPRFCL